MPEIKFERHERDCEYNKERRAKGDVRSILNDFHVIIDGEHRAILSRKDVGRGYWLTDLDGRRIRTNPDNRFTEIVVEAQSLFKGVVLRHLALIPDTQALEEIRAAEGAKLRQQAAEEDAARRQGRLNQAAQRMYDLLREYRDGVGGGWPDRIADVLHFIDNGGELHD